MSIKFNINNFKIFISYHIENVRFWDLPEESLRYIIKDASEAVKVNPTARKANKWADEINDAVTVLYWRKKKGIKEEYIQLVVTEGFKVGQNISKALAKSSTIKMANPTAPSAAATVMVKKVRMTPSMLSL